MVAGATSPRYDVLAATACRRAIGRRRETVCGRPAIDETVREASVPNRRRRTITIELPSDIDPNEYADIAHAAWMMLKIAGRARDSSVLADFPDGNDTLNARWRSYESEAPWT